MMTPICGQISVNLPGTVLETLPHRNPTLFLRLELGIFLFVLDVWLILESCVAPTVHFASDKKLN